MKQTIEMEDDFCNPIFDYDKTFLISRNQSVVLSSIWGIKHWFGYKLILKERVPKKPNPILDLISCRSKYKTIELFARQSRGLPKPKAAMQWINNVLSQWQIDPEIINQILSILKESNIVESGHANRYCSEQFFALKPPVKPDLKHYPATGQLSGMD